MFLLTLLILSTWDFGLMFSLKILKDTPQPNLHMQSVHPITRVMVNWDDQFA